MKSKSITKRLFIQMIALILCFSGMILAGNTLLIKPLYERSIQTKMLNAMEGLSEPNYLESKEAWIDQVNQIDSGEAFDITIESETETLYSSSMEIGIREPVDFDRVKPDEGDLPERKPIFPIHHVEEWEALADGVDIGRLVEPRNNTEMYVCKMELDDGISIYLTQPVEPILDSVKQANILLLSGTVFFLLIASLIAFKMSKTFTSPIKEMQAQVNRLSELDFTGRVEVHTGDELEALGNDIQELSNSLQTALKSLEKEIDAQKRLISDASHELRTPLTLIKGYADEIAAGYVTDADKQQEYVAYISEESAKMKRLINEILELSRLSSGRMSLNLEPGDVKEAIEGFLDKYEGYVEEHGLHVSLDLFEAEGRYDAMRFEQILANYLSNAAKYCDEKKMIRVFMEDQEDTIRVNVYNSGSSIEEDMMEKIWRGFYQADESRANGDSFGLGLSIVLAIQELAGLKAGVYNMDQGVVFWFDVHKDA